MNDVYSSLFKNSENGSACLTKDNVIYRIFDKKYCFTHTAEISEWHLMIGMSNQLGSCAITEILKFLEKVGHVSVSKIKIDSNIKYEYELTPIGRKHFLKKNPPLDFN